MAADLEAQQDGYRDAIALIRAQLAADQEGMQAVAAGCDPGLVINSLIQMFITVARGFGVDIDKFCRDGLAELRNG